jgi:hypothetical protein
LFLRHRYNQILAWQRAKVCDERMRFQQFIEVNVHRVRKRGRASRNVEHLPGANVAKTARIVHEREAGASFESD